MLVVGAGSAGATLAFRLAQMETGRVVLVDAGPDLRAGIAPDWLGDADRLAPAADPMIERTAIRLDGRDGTGRPDAQSNELFAGRLVGGSSAVNGAYFVRGTDSDLARWSRVGTSWAPSKWISAYRAVESDRDLRGARHGDDGPIPVSRHSWPMHPVTEALFAGSEASGVATHPDMNDGAELGWGLVPRNVDGRRRVGADVLLAETSRQGLRPPGLSVHGGVEVVRVVFSGRRAVGVDAVVEGRLGRIVAGTVVLSAGAVGSAHILWRSGVGPADRLRSAGRDVLHDCPGLATRAMNHAAIELMWSPRPGVDPGPLLQGAVHLEVDGLPVEVLATCRSYGLATGEDPHDATISLRVSPMRSRALSAIEWQGDEAFVQGRYLDDPSDRAVLRTAVRQVDDLVHGDAFAGLLGEWHGPDPATLRVDAGLDSWIASRIGTSMHLCSTAPAGPIDDPTAVVDEFGRVRGVEGLRVVDCSILPDVPSRGPAATAMALGELLAPAFTAT